jgi:hypothetical protein
VASGYEWIIRGPAGWRGRGGRPGEEVSRMYIGLGTLLIIVIILVILL